MLEIKDLCIQLGSFALRADLNVGPKQVVAVMGASGSGKSTFLNAIAGFLPSRGHIGINGLDVSDLHPAERPCSMLFQDGNLFAHLTAAQNVGLGISPNLRLSEQDQARVGEVLDRVGLIGLHDRKPADLSGGQQSRVAIARAMLRNRPLMLLDEPFAALGPAMRKDMLELVAQTAMATGSTVLMVTHSPEDARAICNQVIVVEGGVALPPQPTDDVLNNPPEGMRAYLGT